MLNSPSKLNARGSESEPNVGDLPVVDVAGELGRVLVLLVLGLERADAHAVLLAEHDQAAHADVRHHLLEVAGVVPHQLLEDQPAGGVHVAVDLELVIVAAELELRDRVLAPLARDQAQRLVVHRRVEHVGAARELGQLTRQGPVVRVQRAFRRARVVLEALLELARDGGLRGADRAVQQDDAALGAVALRRALQHVHQPHQRDVETEHGVLAAVRAVLEELVPDQLLLVVDVLLDTVRQHHVVEALVRIARDLRRLANQRQVVLEGPLPGELFVRGVVL
jgi:hypothetical protein